MSNLYSISCKNNTIAFNCIEVLADRIAVGCTLNRGEYNLAWNEVMLPDSDDSVSYCVILYATVKNRICKAIIWCIP
jgi:hypothetical protein